MSRDDWETLVQRFADGRPICNCRGAYYTPCGEGFSGGVRKTDMLACQWGCQANLLAAKNEIAAKVVAALNLQTA